ncbi:hypothetical protein HDE_01603 [Halotydeus destructor]|nr:hypothetical protein HDE_01603 [Halotydeus destructor]
MVSWQLTTSFILICVSCEAQAWLRWPWKQQAKEWTTVTKGNLLDAEDIRASVMVIDWSSKLELRFGNVSGQVEMNSAREVEPSKAGKRWTFTVRVSGTCKVSGSWLQAGTDLAFGPTEVHFDRLEARVTVVNPGSLTLAGSSRVLQLLPESAEVGYFSGIKQLDFVHKDANVADYRNRGTKQTIDDHFRKRVQGVLTDYGSSVTMALNDKLVPMLLK